MKWFGVVLAVVLCGAGGALAQPATREIAFVANGDEGTVSVVDVAARAEIGRLDINPARLKEAQSAPNYAQDAEVSPDGRTLYVTRGYLGDVVAVDIASRRLLWTTKVDPGRADHLALSRDAKTLFVAADAQNVVRRLDAMTGKITGQIPAGVFPHDTKISRDGRRLFNTSTGPVGVPLIGGVTTPDGRSPYQLTIADSKTLKVIDTIPFETGVRPWKFTPDESGFYAQLSNQHAVIAFDLKSRKIVRRLDLPIAPGVTAADWAYEAPHHGLALTADGHTLCLAGRGSDYAALVRAPELVLIATVPVGDAPGWAAMADHDRLCLLPNQRSNDLSIVSLSERREIARVKVGKGPKHVVAADVPEVVLAAFKASQR
jgi:DNA-binding beta-propeller fold protein YncE